MSQTPLTDAYLASRCKGENKQSWVEFARGLEERMQTEYIQGAITAYLALVDRGYIDEHYAKDARNGIADILLGSQIGIDQSHL